MIQICGTERTKAKRGGEGQRKGGDSLGKQGPGQPRWRACIERDVCGGQPCAVGQQVLQRHVTGQLVVCKPEVLAQDVHDWRFPGVSVDHDVTCLLPFALSARLDITRFPCLYLSVLTRVPCLYLPVLTRVPCLYLSVLTRVPCLYLSVLTRVPCLYLSVLTRFPCLYLSVLTCFPCLYLSVLKRLYA